VATPLLCAGLVLAACGGSSKSSQGSSQGTVGSKQSSGSPITVALVTSLTGVAGPEFKDTPKGFLARIALQNANGGVNGHKLNPVVIDDGGNISQETTTMQDAIQTKGAFGIVSVTPFMFAGYRYLQQHGIPVTGGSFDGPEWGQQPNTNMFAADTGSVNPTYPANSGAGLFMKKYGGTSSASVGYGISPSSAQSAKNFASSAKHSGLKAPYVNTSIPFGGVDFTATSLAIKQTGADTVYGSMDNNSNFALVQELKNADTRTKIVTFPTGLEPDIVNSPSWQSVQGVYFSDGFVPTQLNTPATQAFQDALQKYSGMAKSDFPTFNIYEGWLGADLFIKGLQQAGSNPSRSAFITNLRGLTSYNGGGLLPQSYNYSTIFGHDSPSTCTYYLQAKATNFQLVSNQPICGSDIPGTGKKA
jgi:branched-chain amino acid transport system substrate-binding protein